MPIEEQLTAKLDQIKEGDQTGDLILLIVGMMSQLQAIVEAAQSGTAAIERASLKARKLRRSGLRSVGMPRLSVVAARGSERTGQADAGAGAISARESRRTLWTLHNEMMELGRSRAGRTGAPTRRTSTRTRQVTAKSAESSYKNRAARTRDRRNCRDGV